MSISNNPEKDKISQLPESTASGPSGDGVPTGHTKQRMAGWTPLQKTSPDEALTGAALMTQGALTPAGPAGAEGARLGTEDDSPTQKPLPSKQRMTGYTEPTGPDQTTSADSAAQQTAAKPSGQHLMAGYTPMNSGDLSVRKAEGPETGDVEQVATSPAAAAAAPHGRKQ